MIVGWTFVCLYDKANIIDEFLGDRTPPELQSQVSSQVISV